MKIFCQEDKEYVILALMFSSLLSDAKLFLTLLTLSLLILLADSIGLLNFPKSALGVVVVPIQYGLYKTTQTVTNEFSFFFLSRRTFQENKALTQQLGQVLSENADLRRRLAETQGFLEEQKSLDPQTYTTVPARPVSLNRFLVIDKGSTDNLKIGQPVVYKDTLIGTLKQVGERSSQVLLLTDPDSKVAAFSSNKDGKAQGILIGQFGSEMLLDQLLHKENISVGDLVYSQGTEGTLPRGLILGVVSQVLDNPNLIFKQAVVRPMFSLGDLDILFVITN